MLGGAENITYRMTAFRTVPMNSQGRNLPQRVLVFAVMMPMMGSLNASKTRATSRMTPIAAAETPMMSWK